MTKETYDKATKLLKEIDEMEQHVLGTTCLTNQNAMGHPNPIEFPYTYPFMPSAYPYMNMVLPRSDITEFYKKYKEALILKYEKLKQEFSDL
jgi:hypothetical protein